MADPAPHVVVVTLAPLGTYTENEINEALRIQDMLSRGRLVLAPAHRPDE